MSDYGFVHEGTVYTPNQTPGLAPEATTARNAAIEAAELVRWQAQPVRQLAYMAFPADHGPRPWKTTDAPALAGATVATWLGTPLGRITSARVYAHNFGGRMIAVTVDGTNGARYHGRASWDHGTCIWLHKQKTR